MTKITSYLMAAAGILVGLGAGACGEEDGSNRKRWSGHVDRDVTWSGEITVTGDLYIERGVTLRIEPGTVITVMADQDDRQEGALGEVDDLTTGDPVEDPDAGGLDYVRSHISIIVNGRIEALGTAEAPIRFVSSKANPGYTDWMGINVHEGVFEYVLVESCVNCIYTTPGHEGMILDHVHVRRSWAACTGFNEAASPDVQSAVLHSTLEDCGHEAIDTHDPGTLEVAYNYIAATQVGVNLHDEMDAYVHHNVIVDTGMPILLVNVPQAFITHCVLESEPQDTSRWTYQGWTMPNIGGTAGVFVTADGHTNAVVTNSVVFDSEHGLRNENDAACLGSGYLNLDNVQTGYYVNAVEGEGSLAVGSQFVDPAGGDYHLQPGSPLIGAGNPVDGSPDIGVYGGDEARAELGWVAPE